MPRNPLRWLLLAGLIASGVAAAWAQGTATGRIVLAQVTGDVTLTNKADNTTRRATANEQIAEGYIVTTAAEASVILVFSNGATLNLRGDSVLDVQTFLQDPFSGDLRVAELTAEPTVSTTRLNLSRGEIVGNVKRLNAAQGSSFTIQTPVGAAGVRGTVFRLLFRPLGGGRAAFALTTTEGNVVLTQGAVEIPVQSVSGDAQEIEIEIDVEVDAATGLVTVTTPLQSFTVQEAPVASAAQVTTFAQQIATAVATLVFPPPPPPPSPPLPTPPPPSDTTTPQPIDPSVVSPSV